MARRPRTEGAVVLATDRPEWEPQPDEPLVWYTRFVEYLRLGPTRTMQRVRNQLCAERGQEAYKCGGHWSRAAQQWRWQERARAWDLEQVRLYTSERRTMEIGMHLRRLAIYNDAMEMCVDVMQAANMSEMGEAEARRAFPQMARLLIKLMREERIECEAFQDLDDEPRTVTITADDLRAAQRALEQRMAAEKKLLEG